VGTDTLHYMADPNEAWEKIFATLAGLRVRWPTPDWSYDRRLKCVASSIPLTRETDARVAMADALPTSFTAESVQAAPAGVKALIEKCGGLRASQLLFWGGEQMDETPGAFGLWWPWGDGTTVSLRIGLHDVDIPKERYPRLRDVFGIPQLSGGS
jgi:hypothetical protein